MIRYFVLCVFGVISATFCAAQGREQQFIDSLLKDAELEQSDTLKIKKLSTVSFRYSPINPDRGIAIGTKALELAQSIGWEPGIGIAIYNRAANYMANTHLSEALRDYQEVVKICEKHGRKSMLAGALGNIGGIYAYKNKDSIALVYYHKALKLNIELHQGWYQAANLCNIGQSYSVQKNYNEALKFILLAINICKDSNYTDLLPPTYNILARVYSGLGDYNKTIINSTNAANLSRGEDLQTFANAMETLGSAIITIISKKNDTLARKYFNSDTKKALHIAYSYLDSAIVIGTKLNDNILLKEVYKDMVTLHEMQGDNKNALQYYRLYYAANDSVYNEKNTERMTQLALQYEFDKKEAVTKALQQKKDNRQRTIRNIISVGLCIAVVFLIVVLVQSRRISKEKQLSDKLLLNILPSEVAKELKANGTSDAKLFDDVTVLFTDFEGFTTVSEKLTPKELVDELHTCFTAFDEIMVRYNIEKIKTVGDAYLAVCGLPVTDKEHAKNVVAASIEIRNFMLARKQQLGGRCFNIRIGIHSGNVVAGIVGVKKFAYDIWGDTVNTAARMEQKCEAGKINISQTTYDLVKGKYACTYRGEIEAKNKGMLKMYYVESTLA